MYSLVISLPFFGFFICFFFGRFFGKQISLSLNLFCSFLSVLLAFLIFFEICLSQAVITIKLYDWILTNYSVISIGFLFDSLTAVMLLIVTLISFFVHTYSLGYMSHDPHITRFMSYLSLFTFFMLILITSDNFLQLFFGWEGVGVCSYLLINFWFTRVLANKAALKAMIMNRIADVFFIIAILLLFINFNTLDYIIIFNLIPFVTNYTYFFLGVNFNLITLISFFLFIGSIGKSAQIGLHTWLPDAMEGPTPVSSLLHAATMVTAGIFLVIRCSPIFEYAPVILFLICIFGGITSFFSAIIGIFQYDVKKVIAYSTCSQLGYMFLSCGLSNYLIAIFHLFNHAFFKALLFLGAGAIIHALYDEQDMRRMGGLINFLPFTYICIFFGSLAIMGFPFLTGFYSKDLLLELVNTRYILDSYFIYFLAVSTAFFTSVYSVRLLLFIFFGKSNLFKSYFISNESLFSMSISMVLLSLLTIFAGFFFSDLFLGFGSVIWGNSIYTDLNNFSYIEPEFLNPFLKNLPLIVSFFGIFFVILINIFNIKLILNNNILFYYYNLCTSLYKFFFPAGFFNYIYNFIFKKLFIFSYEFFTKLVDKGYLEKIGPFGLYYFFFNLSKILRKASPYVIFQTIFFIFFFIFFFTFVLLSHQYLFTLIAINNNLIFISFLIIFLEWYL